MNDFEKEIETGNRFGFGENWKKFLQSLNEERIREAEKSLKDMLGMSRLDGKRFLDVGCGSGLFSLAARNLGASVRSFDYDPDSVGCAEYLKQTYYPKDDQWQIERGSALDVSYMSSMTNFDIVYSWGVLHHTGNMWSALSNVVLPLKPQGQLFIAIYNDQGWRSVLWTHIKRLYCSGIIGKFITISAFFPYFFARTFAKSVVTAKNQWTEYKRSRGMSVIRDWHDWLGGYPFEVASVDAITDFYQKKGFRLSKLVSTNSWGNNQFVFNRN